MNYLLGTEKDITSRHLHYCLLCHKTFGNPRALGGHIKSHQWDLRPRRSWNYPVRSSNSIDNTSTITSNHLPKSTPTKNHSSWGTTPINNPILVPNWPISPLFIAAPSCFSSQSGCAHQVYQLNYLPSIAYAPSSSHAPPAALIPSNSPVLCLCSNAVFPYRTELQPCMMGTQFYCREHNHSYPALYLGFASPAPGFALISTVPPCFQPAAVAVPLPQDLGQWPTQVAVTQSSNSSGSVLTSESAKRPNESAVPDVTSVSKRPRISYEPPAEMEKPAQKVLVASEDVKNLASGSAVASAAKEEDGQACEPEKEEVQPRLDLSLGL